MSRILAFYKSIKSELYWKERIISIFIVLTYILGNGIEYMTQKLTTDSPIVWILGILLGSAVVAVSISKWSKYTNTLFKLFLLYINFNIVYAYGHSTQGDPGTESFYMLMCYILFVVCSQALDSRREIWFFTSAELFFFIVIVYLNIENEPILLQLMHQFILAFVMVGNIIINFQRLSLTQASGVMNVHFKTLSENGRDAQLILSSELQFGYLNPAAEKLTGYRTQEASKMRLTDLIVPEFTESVTATLSELSSKDNVKQRVEYKLKNKVGEELWVESIFSSFKSAPGSEQSLIFAETRDVGARKKLEAEIQQQLMLEEMLIKHSNRFINFERTDFQKGIDQALGEFGKMLNADGVIVYRAFGKLLDEFRSTNSWFSTHQNVIEGSFNTTVLIDQNLLFFLRGMRGEKFNHGNLVQGTTLVNTGILKGDGPMERVYYVIPLQSGNVVNGLVIFVFKHEMQHSQLSFFGLIGNMIASAFTRLRTEMILHEAQLTNEFILRALPDWLYIVNSKGEFTGGNNYSTLPSYIPDYQLKGKTFNEVLPDETAQLFGSYLQQVLDADVSVSFEYLDTSILNGKYFKVIIAPFKANEFLIILRDVTDLKEAQRELEAKARKLEMSNKELEEFAYIVSHDMKQPIRTIISYLSLLRRKHGQLLNEEANEFLNFSIDGATKMSDLIRDILQYSKLEQQISFVVDVSLNGLVKKVLEGLHDTITTRNAEVKIENLPLVKGNETMLTELFQNLIENGIKYNLNDRKEIQVKVADKGEIWEFSVSDNGIGFEQQYADQIFKIFKRLHNDEEFQGTGIGLSICQKVVEKHGGKIWAVSAKGKGSTFYFTIPK